MCTWLAEVFSFLCSERFPLALTAIPVIPIAIKPTNDDIGEPLRNSD